MPSRVPGRRDLAPGPLEGSPRGLQGKQDDAQSKHRVVKDLASSPLVSSQIGAKRSVCVGGGKVFKMDALEVTLDNILIVASLNTKLQLAAHL